MTTIPPFSPGCFGSALAFKEDDSICRCCPFREVCQPVHEENWAALRARVGIVTSPARKPTASKAAPVESKAPILGVPKKVADLLDRLDRGNYDVVRKLQAGENPFGAALPFMKIASHLLLGGKVTVNRELLAAAFTTTLNWQPQTAEAHARMAIQALTHIGAVDNIDGNIAIRRPECAI